MADLLRYFLMAGPPQTVQVPAPVREEVDLRLQSVVLHGQLLRCFNMILVEIAKLPLIAVQFDKFLARGKGRPCLRTALLEGAEKIQVFETQGLKPMQFPGGTAREAAPDPVFPARGPPRGRRGRRSGRRWLAGADGLQPGFQVRLGIAVPQAVQPDIAGPARWTDGNMLTVPGLDLIPHAPKFL